MIRRPENKAWHWWWHGVWVLCPENPARLRRRLRLRAWLRPYEGEVKGKN